MTAEQLRREATPINAHAWKRETHEHDVEPFCFVAGLVALCVGFWRMYFTARRRGFPTWVGGAVLLLIGWLTCIASGVWFLVGHSPFSFA